MTKRSCKFSAVALLCVFSLSLGADEVDDKIQQQKLEDDRLERERIERKIQDQKLEDERLERKREDDARWQRKLDDERWDRAHGR